MSIFELFQYNAFVFYGVVALVSLMVGSFLNVVIHRLPIMMERAWRENMAEYATAEAEASAISADDSGSAITSAAESEPFNLAVPRSRCPACGSEIKAWQNIPVISYLLLAGRCGNCRNPISIRYPIVEFTTMLLSLVVAWQFGPTPQAVLGIVVTWFFVSMTMIDIDHQLLPDSLTLPLMWIGLLAALLPVFTDLQSSVIGAAAGYMVLWLVYQLFRIVTGKEGMGYGDFKLLAAIGALLGWQALPVVILLSSLVGAVVGLALIAITGRDKNIPIPFGPYLAAAGWIAMLWGESLSQWYYGLLA
ncbi:prepilin peptidase [Granulosicoccus sp. 3-233]|uniref:prepilin peptidase n=1 Tax=Granulosicoccus sp. 3-233 TaxID=3417969 RepID=UPI003D32F067